MLHSIHMHTQISQQQFSSQQRVTSHTRINWHYDKIQSTKNLQVSQYNLGTLVTITVLTILTMKM